jgi:nucleotide-binding universal stress UspA family protein
MATHGRTGLDRWLNRSITEGVLHSTQRPMLIVKMPAPQGTL